MIRLTDTQKKLAERLLIMAKNIERDVTYDELARFVGMNRRNVGDEIVDISILCHELGLPLLSAKVVNQQTRLPGKGYYDLRESLGIPREGKTDREIYNADRKAILDCEEWYKLEDYLGLNVGLTRPANHKLLDVRKPVYYQHSEDVLNDCFSTILGKTYNGYMKGSKPFEIGDVGYSVWFPKLSVDGLAASSSGWVNILSDDGKIIEEYGAEKSFDPTNRISFVFAKKGSEPYYFRGVFKVDNERSTDAHRYYYKIADTADLRSSVPLIHIAEDEEQKDNHLIFDLQNEDFTAADNKFEYRGKPLDVPEPQRIDGRIVYPRNRQTAINALVHAGFVCEINPDHPTFIRKSSGKPYTEPHHLVPMAQQEHFKVSLDVEENIVSLCSTCHKHIHYGQGADKLLKKLYKERKEALRTVGIEITEKELLSFYD